MIKPSFYQFVPAHSPNYTHTRLQSCSQALMLFIMTSISMSDGKVKRLEQLHWSSWSVTKCMCSSRLLHFGVFINKRPKSEEKGWPFAPPHLHCWCPNDGLQSALRQTAWEQGLSKAVMTVAFQTGRSKVLVPLRGTVRVTMVSAQSRNLSLACTSAV